MNEKLDYVEMLEIPVNTTNITFKPSTKKTKKSKELESVKEEVIEKVNNTKTEEKPKRQYKKKTDLEKKEDPITNKNKPTKKIEDKKIEESKVEPSVTIKSKEKRSSFNVIAMQVAVIFMLLGVILISNFYIEESGINTFLKSVFGTESASVDNREYSDFDLTLPTGSVLENGIVTYNETDSVYSVADGEVSSITFGEDGKYTITVKHSEKFSSVISGLNHVYVEQGRAVFKNIPIGYNQGNVTMSFYNEEAIVTNFMLDGNVLVWQV